MSPPESAQASIRASLGQSDGRKSPAAGKVSLSKVEQKAETRGRLREAALRLFASQGYDATSASEIAALAGVSDRTFFLHFPTKADAIMGIAEDRLLDLLVDKIVTCETGGSDLDVIEHSLMAWLEAAGDRRTLHQRAGLVMRAAVLSPTVRGKLLDTNDAMVAAAAGGLARRHKLKSPTLEMTVVASVALRVFQGATTEWAQRGPNGFRAIGERHFQALRRAVNAGRDPIDRPDQLARP